MVARAEGTHAGPSRLRALAAPAGPLAGLTLGWALQGSGLSEAALVTAGLAARMRSGPRSVLSAPPRRWSRCWWSPASCVILMTELTSNTAVTSALLPVLAAAAPALGASPVAVCVTAAAAASYAFMLPVGTPPNAIVFAAGRITVGEMARAGLVLNLVGAALVVVAMATLGETVFHL